MGLSNESPSVAFFGISIACIIISQALAYLATQEGNWPGVVSKCAALAIGLQWVVFVPSAMLQTEKFFDLCGSVTYFTLAIYSLMKGETFYARQVIITLCVVAWAVRLGLFLYLRIQRAGGKDGRFDTIKNNIPRFFNMWTIQGLWVFFTALPVFCLNATKANAPFGWVDYLGLLCFGLGFTIEVFADNQKTAFSKDEANQDKWISTGLWAFSRHPNYFGEIVLWVGIFLVSSTVLTGGQWISILSPVFVAFLLIKVSGIPLLEARADDKWGNDPAYLEYKANTSVLIPWPNATNMGMALAAASDSSAGAGLEESLMEGQPPIVEKAQAQV